MTRQKGIIKLKGTIGDITFYKTQDGHLASLMEKEGNFKNNSHLPSAMGKWLRYGYFGLWVLN